MSASRHTFAPASPYAAAAAAASHGNMPHRYISRREGLT